MKPNSNGKGIFPVAHYFSNHMSVFYRDSEIMQQKQKAANEKKSLQAGAK